MNCLEAQVNGPPTLRELLVHPFNDCAPGRYWTGTLILNEADGPYLLEHPHVRCTEEISSQYLRKRVREGARFEGVVETPAKSYILSGELLHLDSVFPPYDGWVTSFSRQGLPQHTRSRSYAFDEVESVYFMRTDAADEAQIVGFYAEFAAANNGSRMVRAVAVPATMCSHFVLTFAAEPCSRASSFL
jgi:hypothetical protein